MRNSVKTVPHVCSLFRSYSSASVTSKNPKVVAKMPKIVTKMPEKSKNRCKNAQNWAPELKLATRNSVGGAGNSTEELRTKKVRICRTLNEWVMEKGILSG